MFGFVLLSLVVNHHALISPPPEPVVPPVPSVVATAPAVPAAPQTAIVGPVPTAASEAIPPAPAAVSAPVPTSTTTTTTTTLPPTQDLSGLECVVVLGASNPVTFGPGPVDPDGTCNSYWATYPTAVSITVTQETVTAYGS